MSRVSGCRCRGFRRRDRLDLRVGRRCGRRVSRRRFRLPRARLPAENDDKSAGLTSSWMAASGLSRRSPRLRTRDDQASAHRATGIGRPVLRFTNRTHRWAASGRRSPRPVVRGPGWSSDRLGAAGVDGARGTRDGQRPGGVAAAARNRVAGKGRSLPARRSRSRTTVATIVSQPTGRSSASPTRFPSWRRLQRSYDVHNPNPCDQSKVRFPSGNPHTTSWSSCSGRVHVTPFAPVAEGDHRLPRERPR